MSFTEMMKKKLHTTIKVGERKEGKENKDVRYLQIDVLSCSYPITTYIHSTKAFLILNGLYFPHHDPVANHVKS